MTLHIKKTDWDKLEKDTELVGLRLKANKYDRIMEAYNNLKRILEEDDFIGFINK